MQLIADATDHLDGQVSFSRQYLKAVSMRLRHVGPRARASSISFSMLSGSRDRRAAISARLDVLAQTDKLSDLAPLPGFNFHRLKGFKPERYTVHANGPWCITFEFDAGDVYRVNFEQYH